MKLIHSAACCAIFAVSTALSNGGTEYSFGPVKAESGARIKMVSHIESSEGIIQPDPTGLLKRGSVTSTRDSELVWTFREPESDGTVRGMVRVLKLVKSVNTTIDGKAEKTSDPSPLSNKLIAMTKATGGDWKFELDGSIPRFRVENEVSNMTAYLKRKWYPDHKVKLGDTWEFDPKWIRMLVHRDFKNAQVIGTMRLRQVRHIAGSESALIDVKIRSSGGDFNPDGTAMDYSLVLDGTLTVNLKTMLEENMELKGTATSKISTATENHTTELPVLVKVTKSFSFEPAP